MQVSGPVYHEPPFTKVRSNASFSSLSDAGSSPRGNYSYSSFPSGSSDNLAAAAYAKRNPGVTATLLQTVSGLSGHGANNQLRDVTRTVKATYKLGPVDAAIVLSKLTAQLPKIKGQARITATHLVNIKSAMLPSPQRANVITVGIKTIPAAPPFEQHALFNRFTRRVELLKPADRQAPTAALQHIKSQLSNP